MFETVRPAAMAGHFYPADPHQCRTEVTQFLDQAQVPTHQALPLKALIVPHAGYMYSGPVAATAYRLLREHAATIRRVVLIGPNHRVPLRGIAAPTVSRFRTPLGDVALDTQAIAALAALPSVVLSDLPHRDEHCLEVQLPFLQTVLGEFRLVPLVVGSCPPEPVAAVLEQLWGGPETVIVVSSDLSHYLTYDEARVRDAGTCQRIETLDTQLDGEEACGCRALNGFLLAARAHGLGVKRLDLRNSGDTAGNHSRVVGYGAFVAQ